MSIRIDRVVTRGGDTGRTSLGDGSRVAKNSARIEAMGCLDELNAVTGLLRCHVAEASAEAAQLAQLQNWLFDMGAVLCQPKPANTQQASLVGQSIVAELERWMEQLREAQAPLTSFILPGGTPAAAWAHLARTQARTVERRVVALAQEDAVSPDILKILNRLSDYFFVLARHFNQDGRTDLVWTPAAQRAAR